MSRGMEGDGMCGGWRRAQSIQTLGQVPSWLGGEKGEDVWKRPLARMEGP